MSLTKRPANTYLEGLIILLIIGVLLALFWPIFRDYRDKVAASRAKAAAPITTPKQ